jgi:uncharacterized circularly permuted ATP-grasp superfamily protein
MAQIEAGLVQRADLLEAGDGRSLRPRTAWSPRGTCPPRWWRCNPEWLRPLVGVRPAFGHFLHFIAFEIGRGPDGRWWVLGDRTQAPSGAGFALENRVATSARLFRALPEKQCPPPAGFFRAFRDALNGLRAEPRAAGWRS